MAHADPSAPATHVCWPLMCGAVTQDSTRDAARYKTPSQSLKVHGTGVPWKKRRGCASHQGRGWQRGLWVFLPALGLTVDQWDVRSEGMGVQNTQVLAIGASICGLARIWLAAWMETLPAHNSVEVAGAVCVLEPETRDRRGWAPWA